MKRHLFINPLNNHHAFGIMAATVFNGYCKPEMIDVVYDKRNIKPDQDRFNVLEKIEAKYDIDDLDEIDLRKYATVNFSSLIPQTASYVEKVMKLGVSVDDIWIHLTDDEVNRWRLLYDRLGGRLLPIKRYKIDRRMINILSVLNNFHIEHEPYGNHLERILKRKLNLSGYNVYTPESLMPKPLVIDKGLAAGEILISINTKPGKLSFTIYRLLCFALSFVLSSKISKRIKHVKIIIWTAEKNPIVAFVRYLLKMKSSDQVNVEIIQLNSLPYVEYIELYSRVAIALKQVRGGGAGAIATIINGGVVIQPKNRKYRPRLFNWYGKSSIYSLSLLGLIRFFKKALEEGFEKYDQSNNESIRFYNQYRVKRDAFFEQFYQ